MTCRAPCARAFFDLLTCREIRVYIFFKCFFVHPFNIDDGFYIIFFFNNLRFYEHARVYFCTLLLLIRIGRRSQRNRTGGMIFAAIMDHDDHDSCSVRIATIYQKQNNDFVGDRYRRMHDFNVSHDSSYVVETMYILLRIFSL